MKYNVSKSLHTSMDIHGKIIANDKLIMIYFKLIDTIINILQLLFRKGELS